MAYPYYPQAYNMPYSQAAMQQFQQALPIQQQTQSSSFIHVQSEAQAREWAVAPNTSMTFIDDNAPYCYTKTMGGSMLEPPVFKRFRLVEEEAQTNTQAETAQTPLPNMDDYLTKADFEPYKAIIEEMQKIAKELNGNE